MAYLPIDDATTAISDNAAAASALARRLAENLAEHATTRLKRASASWYGGPMDTTIPSESEASQVLGAEGPNGYTGGARLTTRDAATRGLEFSTPTWNPLCIPIPWPLSANARGVRLVLYMETHGRQVGTREMEVYAAITVGGSVYPAGLTRAGFDVASANRDTADVLQFGSGITAQTSYKAVGGSTPGTDTATYVDVAIDCSARFDSMDYSAITPGDLDAPSTILLFFLSRIEDLQVDVDQTAVSASGTDGLTITTTTAFQTLATATGNAGKYHRAIVTRNDRNGSTPYRVRYTMQLRPTGDCTADAQFVVTPRWEEGYDRPGTVELVENTYANLFSISIQETP